MGTYKVALWPVDVNVVICGRLRRTHICAVEVDVVVVVGLQGADDGPVSADWDLGIVDEHWEDWFFNVGEVALCVRVIVDVCGVHCAGCHLGARGEREQQRA